MWPLKEDKVFGNEKNLLKIGGKIAWTPKASGEPMRFPHVLRKKDGTQEH